MKRDAFPSLLITNLILLCLLLIALIVLTHTPTQALTGVISPLQALTVPVCPSVVADTPPNPAFIRSTDAIFYRWSGEPAGVARREVLLFDVSLPDWGTSGVSLPGPGYAAGFHWPGFAAVFPADPGDESTSGQAVIRIADATDRPGTYNWLALLYDASGVMICRSVPYWLDVRGAPPGEERPVPNLSPGAPTSLPLPTMTLTAPTNTPTFTLAPTFTPITCGDGVCNPALGETHANCPADCP